jgi:UDP-3-O-[3-hydroxymyristoyl] glucosamine N-acyltransferase
LNNPISENQPRFKLSELAERFALELNGDADHEVTGVGTLRGAGERDISFFANRKYLQQLKSTSAGVVLVNAGDAEHCRVNCLISDDPYVSYARIADLFDYRTPPSPGIHASAVIHETASIGDQVYIGPNAVIDAGTVIGSGSRIEAGCVIGKDCVLGQNCFLYPNVTLAERVKLGQRVIVHSGAVIGGDGFGMAFASDHWEKIPQLGGVTIGDDCEIGPCATIDRGAIEDTVLEEDVRLDNYVHIAHNVYIGAHSAIAGHCGIAGSSRIGRYCMFGGGVGIFGHIQIADRVTISNMTPVGTNITEEGSSWAGCNQAVPTGQWRRIVSHWRKLDEYVKRIRQLEKKTGENNGHD